MLICRMYQLLLLCGFIGPLGPSNLTDSPKEKMPGELVTFMCNHYYAITVNLPVINMYIDNNKSIGANNKSVKKFHTTFFITFTQLL